MSDGQRREKPKFEPPPWEREAFDEFARRRAEREAVDIRRAAKAQEAQPGVVTPSVASGAAVQRDSKGAPKAGALDETKVDAMLQELRAEETTPSVAGGMARLAGGMTAVIGAAMTVVGLLSLVRTRGGFSLLGSLTVTVFGLGFLGLGAWVWMSSKSAKGS
jgi:hypothetical protein